MLGRGVGKVGGVMVVVSGGCSSSGGEVWWRCMEREGDCGEGE